MVLNDDHLETKQVSKENSYKLIESLSSAKLYDRFAAFIIDYSVILSPLIWFLISPFKKQMGVYALTGESSLNSFVIFNIVVVLLSLSFIYNFLFTCFFGATLGQIFMKIKIKSIVRNESSTVYDAFIRSLIFSISLLLGGLPFVFILLHPNHRSIHELVSDTYTFSLVRNTTAKKYNVQPFRFVFILSTILFFFSSLFIFSSYYKLNYSHSTLQAEQLCEDIDQIEASWPEAQGLAPKRLSIAMALYAIDGAGKECLEQEANYVFKTGEESELAYLAKAFVFAGEAKRSDEYLEKVCQIDEGSEACKIAQVIDGWAQDDYDAVDEAFADLNTSSPYVNIWKSRYFLSKGMYQQALNSINTLPKVNALSDYASTHKIKLYWYGREYKLSQVIFDSYLEKTNTEKITLAHWMCSEELQLSCENSGSSSCDYVEQESQKLDYIGDLALLQKLDCQENYATHPKFEWNHEVTKMIDYLDKQVELTEASLIDFISTTLFIDKNIPVFVIEKFLKQQSEPLSDDLLNTLISFTDSLKIRFEKNKISAKILDVLVQQKEFNFAFEFGQNYIDNSSENYLKNMVISSFYADQLDFTKIYLSKTKRQKQLAVQRTLAGEEEVNKIEELLLEGEQ